LISVNNELVNNKWSSRGERTMTVSWQRRMNTSYTGISNSNQHNI